MRRIKQGEDVKVIDVAIGVLKKEGRICLSQRQKHQTFAEKWEFPGGKVEKGESFEEALIREFKEELNIDTQQWQPLIEVPWHYEKLSVRLHVFETEMFSGNPIGNEGQEVAWFLPNELSDLDFPEANKGIVSAIQLPHQYMMSGPYQDVEDALNKIQQGLASGIEICQLKNRGLNPDTFTDLVCRATVMCHSQGAKILLNGDIALLEQFPDVDGIQLSAQAIGDHHSQASRPIHQGKLLGISTHSLTDIEKALTLEPNFLMLSPIKPTASHPDLLALGWQEFERLVKEVVVPVYALGGMKPEDVERARNFGAQGVAAISGYWPK